MEQPKYLIDTNVVIYYLGNNLTPKGMNFMNNIIDVIPNISVITQIEVLGFQTTNEHYKTLTNFIDDSNVLNLSNDVVKASIEIRKNYKTKLPDAIISATAIVYDLTLITRNTKDFSNINGLKVIDPFSL